MYLIITKSFPPDVGGMQNLMWGLTNELSKHYMLKVFADYHHGHKSFDEQTSYSIEKINSSKRYSPAYPRYRFVAYVQLSI